MNTKYYLAVDIGASSGRHMLSHLENGKIVLEEIYRFPNGMIEKNGHKVWDVDQLFQEILIGMKKCAMVGKITYSLGIDTSRKAEVQAGISCQLFGGNIDIRTRCIGGCVAIKRFVYFDGLDYISRENV